MQKKLITTRAIAIGLGILLIIAIIVVFNQHRKITDLESPAKQNITAQRDVIREECSKTDPDSKERCADALQHLSDLLAEFSKQRASEQALPVQDASVTNVQTVPVQ